MGAKNRISVMVGKRRIYLEGDKSEAYLNRVQVYYNSLMDKMLSETDYNRLDDDLKCALISFNIIDELLTAKDNLQNAINDNKNKERENYSLNHDLGSLQIKYEALKKQYDELEKKSNYQKVKVESSLITNARDDISNQNIRQVVRESARQNPNQNSNQNVQQVSRPVVSQNTIQNPVHNLQNPNVQNVNQNTQQAIRPTAPISNQNTQQVAREVAPAINASQNIQQVSRPAVSNVQNINNKLNEQKRTEEFMASINKTFGMNAGNKEASSPVSKTSDFTKKENIDNSKTGSFPPNFNNALKPL